MCGFRLLPMENLHTYHQSSLRSRGIRSRSSPALTPVPTCISLWLYRSFTCREEHLVSSSLDSWISFSSNFMRSPLYLIEFDAGRKPCPPGKLVVVCKKVSGLQEAMRIRRYVMIIISVHWNTYVLTVKVWPAKLAKSLSAYLECCWNSQLKLQDLKILLQCWKHNSKFWMWKSFKYFLIAPGEMSI